MNILRIVIFTLLISAENLKADAANSYLGIDINEILQISISAFPKRFEVIKATDSSQIILIVDYLNSIKPNIAKPHPQRSYGGGYLIQIKFKDKSVRTFNHSGNLWFGEKNKFEYDMKYEEAIRIGPIVAEIIEQKLILNGTYNISGILVSIKSLPSGRHISCVIKDEKNQFHNVNLKKTPIVDSTGSGWMILHEKDEVDVFYSKENKISENKHSALMVIIKKTCGQCSTK